MNTGWGHCTEVASSEFWIRDVIEDYPHSQERDGVGGELGTHWGPLGTNSGHKGAWAGLEFGLECANRDNDEGCFKEDAQYEDKQMNRVG